MPRRLPANPWPLTLAVVLVLLEAAVLAVLGLLEAVSLHSDRLTMGLTTATFLFLYAAGLAWCALKMAQHESWARSPVMLSQLIQLGLAWNFREQPTTWVAVALGVSALLVIAGVLHPASLDALTDDPEAR